MVPNAHVDGIFWWHWIFLIDLCQDLQPIYLPRNYDIPMWVVDFFIHMYFENIKKNIYLLSHCRWVSKLWIYLSFVRLLPNRDLPHLTREFFNKGRLISGSLCGTFNFTWKKIICYHSSPMDSHKNSLFVLFSSKNELVFAL